MKHHTVNLRVIIDHNNSDARTFYIDGRDLKEGDNDER